MRTPITSLDQLTGRWTACATDIVGWNHWLETFEFTSDGVFVWCLQQNKDDIRTSGGRFRFDLTAKGFRRYKDGSDQPFHIEAWFENHDLVLRPPHGFRTWFRYD